MGKKKKRTPGENQALYYKYGLPLGGLGASVIMVVVVRFVNGSWPPPIGWLYCFMPFLINLPFAVGYWLVDAYRQRHE